MGDRHLPGPLYASSKVYSFQADGVARSYLSDVGKLVTWSTGLGKSHLAMMVSALLFEDDLIDLVLVVCEGTKVSEWVGDFRIYTQLDTKKYTGTVDRRRKLAVAPPEVLVGTYETFRNDVAVRVPGRARALADGFLTGVVKNQRVLVIYDEMAKLKNRSSGNYRHHEYLLRQIRKHGSVRVLGLTATPIERDPENVLNLARLICPGIMTIERFEAEHIQGFDLHGKPYGFKNLGPGDHEEPWVIPLSEKLAPILLVKSKSDPDVRAEFPDQIEEFSHVPMTRGQADLYGAVCELDNGDPHDPSNPSPLAMMSVLRQVASYPESLTRSQGELARLITAQAGVEGLAALGSGKRDRLLAHLEHLVTEQGLKVVIFSFFGQSVIPLLHRDLLDAGHTVALNIGGRTRAENDHDREWFRKGNASVYLSSDAGSRGVNLPEASWIINYELPRLYATYEQRINRNHRIDSELASVYAHSYIVPRTIEEALATTTIERNEWWDSFMASTIAAETKPYVLTALDRRLMMTASRQAQETDE